MDKTLKSGIIAGLAGFLLMIIVMAIFFSAWFQFGNSPVAIFSMMAAFAMAFLVAGTMAGALALPDIRTAWDSFLPGLVAGFVAAALPLLGLLLFIFFDLYRGLSGDGLSMEHARFTLPLILLIMVGIGLAGLCSALTIAIIFFWREFRSAPEPEKGGDLESLGTLYDELWEDARTLVADMNQSIAVYRIAGLFLVISGIVLAAFALAGWLQAFGGGYSIFEFIFTVAATICGPAEIIIGSYLISWYSKLKKRYARLASMEKAAGD